MYNKTDERIALIDADIIAYTAAARAEGNATDSSDVIAMIEGTVEEWLPDGWFQDQRFFATVGPTFRHDLNPDYKAHRKDVPKPTLLPSVRTLMNEMYHIEVAEGLEADDLIAQNIGPNTVVVSTDKDFAQLPGWLYNPNKYQWPRYIDESEAAWNLAVQVLMGDSADNIKGLPGIGAAKAPRILSAWLDGPDVMSSLLDVQGAYDVTRRLYCEHYDDMEKGCNEHGLNWTMVYLLREGEPIPNKLPLFGEDSAVDTNDTDT